MRLLWMLMFFVGCCSVCLAQAEHWSTLPIYRQSVETFNGEGKLTIYADGLSIGECDPSFVDTEDQSTPFSTILKFYNAQSKADLLGVFYLQSMLERQDDERIRNQYKMREEGVDIFIDSILEYENSEGEIRAYVKLWLEKEGLEQPVFALKGLVKKDGKYLVAPTSLIRGLGIAFLSIKTNVFAGAIRGEDDALDIRDAESVSLIKFSKIINEWLASEDAVNNSKLQNLGW